jgi:hypothetical protein
MSKLMAAFAMAAGFAASETSAQPRAQADPAATAAAKNSRGNFYARLKKEHA